MSKRISKKELKEDVLISLLQKGNRYIKENTTKIQIYGGVGIGIIILIIFGISTIKSSSTKAQSEFTKAQNLYLMASPIQPEGYRQAKKGFQDFQEKYGRNKWANAALFYQGMSHYQLKEYKDATGCFERFLKKNQEHLLAPVSQEKLANIYEQQRQFKKAISAYQELIQKYPEGFNISYAYLSIGRCYEELGDKSNAIKSYKKVLAKSAWVDDAQFYLKRLNG